MDSDQINFLGKRMIVDFLGAFPLDRLPPSSCLTKNNCGFIVNTQTHNLPGEHWLAVYIGEKSIHAFDPLGIYYPSQLVAYLQQGYKRIYYNNVRYQDPKSHLCGLYCLVWLTNRKAASKSI